MRCLAALLILLPLLLGCWIRWQYAVNDPLWIDELHTSWVVSGGWSDIAGRAAMGNQSPLYFWGVYPVVQLLGPSPINLRLLSLIAGCATLLIGPWLVWSRTRSVISTAVTASVLAIESQLVFYSSEARPYALLQLGGLLFVWLAFRQVEQSESRFSWLTLLLAGALVFIHPTAVLLTAAVAVMLFLMRLDPQRRDGLGIVLASLCGIVCNPATGTWFARRGLWSGLVDLPLVLGTGVGILLAGWVVPASVRCWMKQRGQVEHPTAECFLSSESRHTRPLPPEWFWFGCFLLPWGLAVSASWLQFAGLANARYLATIWSFPAMGLGFLVAGLPIKRSAALAALGFFLLAFGGVPWRGAERWELVRTNPFAVNLAQQRALIGLRNEGWGEIHQQLLSRTAEASRTIWLYPNLIEDELVELASSADDRLSEYLCFALNGIYRIENAALEPRSFRAAKLMLRRDVEILSHREVLVVVRCAGRDLETLQRDWERDWTDLTADESGLRVTRVLSAGDVHLLTLQRATQPRRTEQAK